MTKGLVSTLQSYSTKDGPGIRTTVFLVGCNLRCAWCANPELMLPDEKHMYFAQRCIRCGACVTVAGGAVRLADEEKLPGQGGKSAETGGNKASAGNRGCEINWDAMTEALWQRCVEICPQSAYEKVGEWWEPEKLAAKLLRDKAFYLASGGGVTFSGGEAGLQDEFVRETAAILRKEGIEVTLDTAGLLPWERFEKLLSEIDLVLYDIKTSDSGMHRKCTGVPNEVILENARKTADMGKPMWIRLVVVPGWNDDLHDIRERLRFVKSLGSAVKRVDVLKYHILGVGKYTCLGMDYPIPPGTACSEKLVEDIRRIAEEEGVRINVEN